MTISLAPKKAGSPKKADAPKKAEGTQE